MWFESNELKSKVEELEIYVNEKEIEVYWGSDSIFELLKYERLIEDDELIKNSSLVNVSFSGEAVEFECTLECLIEMVEITKKGKLINNYTFLGDKISYLRIDTPNIIYLPYSDFSEFDFRTNITIEETNYKVDLEFGITSFNFKIHEDGLYNKELYFVYDETFVKIESDKEIDSDILEEIFNAYFFELKSTFGLEIVINPWEYESGDMEDDIETEIKEVNLRPLLKGKGVKEVLKIYKSAFHTSFPEQQILSFSRVIEYVSQTVINKDLLEKTTIKLSSRRALSPDSTYILELGRIFDEHRELRKDYQAIKITIETCCDLFDLVEFAPPFLKRTNKVSIESKFDIKSQAFAEISDAVSTTRNMFAHAKTNYKYKGSECPEEQLESFAEFMDIIAQQTIRWFAAQKEEARIV